MTPKGGTGAASTAGAHITEKIGARVSPTQGAVLDGCAETAAVGNEALPATLFSLARVWRAISAGATGRRDARAPFSRHATASPTTAPPGPVRPRCRVTSAPRADGSAKSAYSGTSMASPHVTGVAAPCRSGRAEAGPARLAQVMTAGAATGKVPRRGPGSPTDVLEHRPADGTVPDTGPVAPGRGRTCA